MITFGQIRFERFEQLVQQIVFLPEEIQRRISAEIEASCLTIIRNAKRAAPKNLGRLIQGITYIKHDPLHFELISGADYSAYMEFGTGSLTSIPAGFQDFAAEFKGVSISTGGVTLKQAIFKWAEQKGIARELWYPIYMKIARYGVRPHPFFIPAVLQEIDRMYKRINKYINNTDE